MFSTFYKITELPGKGKCAIFRIPTQRGDQFLCTYYESENLSVVELDTEYLLKLWRNEIYGPHRSIANGNPETWSKDYKFQSAAEGFALGESNPVPLAYLTCAIHDEFEDMWERHLFFSEST